MCLNCQVLTWRGKALVLSFMKPGMRWLSMDAMLNSVPAGRGKQQRTQQHNSSAQASPKTTIVHDARRNFKLNQLLQLLSTATVSQALAG
jgi:hypothetical protein